MRSIPLTKGQCAIVDDSDYDAMVKWKWYALKQPNTYYAVRDVRVGGKKKSIWMHREINGTPPESLTDHINGDGLDNRRENLRSVPHQDNMVNSHRWRTPTSSKYRGVSWHKSNHKWYAQITVDWKNVYIGSFSSEDEAKAAYDAKRAELRRGKIYRKDAQA